MLLAAGLAAAVHASPMLFKLAQLPGIALLLYLAIRSWRARKTDERWAAAPDAGLLRMARNEFVLAAGNPKAIAVLTVLAPRVIDPANTSSVQLATLTVAFLFTEWTVIAVYAALGTQSMSLLRHSTAWRQLLARIGVRPSR